MITSVVPKLPFIHKQPTLDFYVNQLGFELMSDYGDYLIMKREGAELHFFSFPGLESTKSDFMIYVRISNGIDTFYQDLIGKKVAIHPNAKLESKAWNQKEFAIIDPNGTLLTFGEAI